MVWKKGTKIVAEKTMETWGTTEGRRATVVKEYYYNGEFHVKATWDDTGEAFGLPSIFFDEVK